MCGIFYLNKTLYNFLDKQKINAKFQALKHRGPDHTGSIIVDNQFFGAHRLKITGSDSGNQPLTLDNLILICNGQIYNYKELATKYQIPIDDLRTDIDIILRLYHKGISIEDFSSELDGDFAFLLYDPSKGIYIGRDVFGVRPLFMIRNKEGYIEGIASEVKALTNLIDNDDFKGNFQIERFMPGDLFYQNIDCSKLEIKCIFYKNMTFSEHNKVIDKMEAQKTIYDLLYKAVQKRIDESDRPVAFLCSGGIDSSIILSLAHKHLEKLGKDLNVYSMQYENSNSYDAFYVSMLIKELQQKESNVRVNYFPITFNQNDVIDVMDQVAIQIESYDPNTIRASIPMYLLAKKLKNTNDKVFLSGEGADELFLGYDYFRYVSSNEDVFKESCRLVCNLHAFDVLRADRCFNAHGLEIRVPFLDKDLVRYIGDLDESLLMYHNGIEKHLLRESFREQCPELVSSRIIDRQKERFSDGCGFSYIPMLLNHISRNDPNASSLQKKEINEKNHWLEIFNKHYNNLTNLIPSRELPKWCSEIAKNKDTPLMMV
jgi:asparagine synthase (glutamine-hydrolysing)